MDWRRDIDDWFISEVLVHASQFRAFALRLCRNPEEADDLVHEAYVAVLRVEDFRTIEAPKSFVFRILQNLAVDRARRARIISIENIPNLEILNATDPSPDAHARLVARQELAQLENAIRALPTSCRRVVTLRKIYELSPREIAAELRLSVSTIEKHLRRGMQLLAQAMNDAPPPPQEAKSLKWPRTTKTDER